MIILARSCRLLALISGIVAYASIAMASGSPDEGRPQEHFCPLTLEVMREPVVAADGHSYERAAIVRHFEARGATSPLTRQPINREVFSNHALKTMIEEWRPGRREGVTDPLERRDAESIAQRVRTEFGRNEALSRPEQSSQGRHIVAFLGNTGAGKSTLVNLLAGKALVVGPGGDDYVLARPDDAAMVIGREGNSETLYPKSIDVGDLRFFDLPGFNDTDGSERNLVNAAFIRRILLDAASVRLVFVAGHDQFTADRGASIKQMFNAIRRLFVVEDDQLVREGVFVATKIIGNAGSIADSLLRLTNSTDKRELNEQLQHWRTTRKLCFMSHAVRDAENAGARGSILEAIRRSRAARIRGINVSVLYPPETSRSLERVFSDVMERVLGRQLATSLTTLSDYDREIAFYTAMNFWERFDGVVCAQEASMGLLKGFCINPYNQALRGLERKDAERAGTDRLKLQTHVRSLRSGRQRRVQDIERRTEARTRGVIASVVPKPEGDDPIVFDFAYHRDFYDQVCGAESIGQLATDPPEQDVVRRQYAGFISLHSHEQMLRWHQRFSGVEGLARQLGDMTRRVDALTTRLDDLAARFSQHGHTFGHPQNFNKDCGWTSSRTSGPV